MNERQRRRQKLRRRRRRRRLLFACAIAAALALVIAGVALTTARRHLSGVQAAEEGDIIVMPGAGDVSAENTGVGNTNAGNLGAENADAGNADAENTAAGNTDAGSTSPAGTGAQGTASASAGNDANGSGTDGDTPALLTAAPLSQTIQLTEAQRATGDLILVNKNHSYDFERNSETIQLVNILKSQSYQYPVDKEEFQVAKRILKSLDSMIHDCDQTMGTQETGISSASRTLEYQQTIWDETVDEYGTDYAEQYVAKPGCSEHHTGLAVDMGIFYDDGSYGSFSESENAEWMAANCYKYGFIRRYAEDKVEVTGISNEAWHFRYVGIPHAAYMHQNNLCLEEYLSYLKENTSEEQPLTIEYDGGSVLVYYTISDTITRPGSRYELSGDNCGGCVVTIYPK